MEDPKDRPAKSPETRIASAGVCLYLLGGLAVLALHVFRYPPQGIDQLRLDPFVLPSPGKVFIVLEALAYLLLFNLAAAALGLLPERWLPAAKTDDGFRWLYRLGFGFAILAVAVLLLASLHQLGRSTLLFVILLPPALAALHRLQRSRSLAPVQLRAALDRHRLFLLLIASLLLLNSFLAVFSPEYGWDALTNHLALPERYLFENRIVVTPFSQLSAYPFLMQMLYLPALSFQGPGLATLLHFEFGVLVLIGVYVFCRRFSSRAGLFALAVLLADPLFQTQLGWAYCDLTLTFYSLLAFRSLAHWLEIEERRSLVIFGLFSGVCVLVKILGVFTLIAGCMVVWFPPRLRRVRTNLAACAVSGALTLVVALPWLVRNAIFTANPFSPLVQTLFHQRGSEYFDPIAIKESSLFLARIGMGHDLCSLLALPWNLTMEVIPNQFSNSFGFQVTPLLALGCIAALGIGFVRRIPQVAAMLKIAGIVTVLWFFTSQDSRYLLPAFPLIAIAGGLGWDAICARDTRFGKAVVLLPVIAVAYCQFLLVKDLPTRYGYAFGNLSHESLQKRIPVLAAAAELHRRMGATDRVVLCFESRGYYFKGLNYIPYHLHEGSPLLQMIHRQQSVKSLQCRLQQLGVTYLLINRKHARDFSPVFIPEYGPTDFSRDVDLLKNLATNESETVFSQGGIWVGRLNPVANCEDRLRTQEGSLAPPYQTCSAGPFGLR